eukprot:2576777-Prymnesium_polylepis.1
MQRVWAAHLARMHIVAVLEEGSAPVLRRGSVEVEVAHVLRALVHRRGGHTPALLGLDRDPPAGHALVLQAEDAEVLLESSLRGMRTRARAR